MIHRYRGYQSDGSGYSGLMPMSVGGFSMGIVDKMKETLGGDKAADKAKENAKDKSDQVSGKASQMGDKAKGMVDQGGDMVDQKTGGKASGQVDSGQDKAKDIIDKKMPGS